MGSQEKLSFLETIGWCRIRCYCGCSPVLGTEQKRGDKNIRYSISCIMCGKHTLKFDTDGQANRSWNKREVYPKGKYE